MPVMVKKSEKPRLLGILTSVLPLDLLISCRNGRRLNRLLKYGEKKGGNEMKIYVNGLKIFICPECGLEVPSLKCKVIDPQKPNRDDNWIEICQKCEEEVKENEAI